MRYLSMRHLIMRVTLFLAVLLLPLTALAQGVDPSTLDPASLATKFVDALFSRDWTTGVAFGLIGIVYATRFLTTKEAWPWLHSKAWTIWSTGGVFVVTAAAKALAASGFNAHALVGAITLAVLNVVAISNPTLIGVVTTPPEPAGGFVSLRLMILGTIATLLVACACWQPTNVKYNTPECIVARASVDCTVAAFKDEAGRGLSLVTELIAHGTFDAATLLDALKNAGFQSGECILASAANALGAKAAGASYNEAAFLKSWNDWRGTKRPGVIYKGADKPNIACISRLVA